MAMLAGGLLITALLFFARQKADLDRIFAWAKDEAQAHELTLEQGVRAYASLNQNVAAFFAASERVSPDEFDTYLRYLDLLTSESALSAIGYLPRTPLAPRAGAETSQDRPTDLYPLRYCLPEGALCQHWRGLDFYESAERREAMDKAATLGRPVATAKLAEPRDTGQRPIVMVFTPVYASQASMNTLAQRRAALKGFVFSVFRTADMIEKVMGQRFKNMFDLEIYDSEAHADNRVYDGDNVHRTLTHDGGNIAVHQAGISFAGRPWQLYFFPKPSYFERHATASDYLILLAGALASLVLSFATGSWLQRRAQRRALIERGHRFQSMFENHPFAVYYLDTDRRFINVNAKAEEEFQASKQELIGSSAESFIVPENRPMAQARWQEVLAGNATTYDNVIVGRQGKRSDVSVVLIPISVDGKVDSALGIAQNITERKNLEQRLRVLALHDGLTGLPNRRLFLQHLDQTLQRSRRRRTPLALLYFDIDRFKQINDRYGHDVGDQAIVEFARRVRRTVRESDLVARLGGDEFAVVAEDLPSAEAAQRIADKLIEAMAPPFDVGGHRLAASTSIGIALHAEGMGADALIRAADQAMYLAKQAGRNRFHIGAPSARP